MIRQKFPNNRRDPHCAATTNDRRAGPGWRSSSPPVYGSADLFPKLAKCFAVLPEIFERVVANLMLLKEFVHPHPGGIARRQPDLFSRHQIRPIGFRRQTLHGRSRQIPPLSAQVLSNVFRHVESDLRRASITEISSSLLHWPKTS